MSLPRLKAVLTAKLAVLSANLVFFIVLASIPIPLAQDTGAPPPRIVQRAGLAPFADVEAANVSRVSGTIRRGQSLWHVLKAHGIVRADIQPAIAALNQHLDPHAIKPGQKYEIERDAQHKLVAYRFHADLLTSYIVERAAEGGFTAHVKKKALQKQIETLTGSIGTSLYESIAEKGESPELILSFSDIFQWDIDFFTDPQPGDSYRIVFESYYLGDRRVRYGNILAAQYENNGKTITAFYFKGGDKQRGYYDWDGQSLQKTFLKSPLNYRRISSFFSWGRRHPILKRIRPHLGVDYAANRGTPVEAAADGVVVETGYQARGLGRFIKIKHPNSQFMTAYGHLHRLARGIRKGVRVTQKQVIGYVGSTGLATGPHLHYTFYENGRPVNPLRILNTSTVPVATEDLEAFKRQSLDNLRMLSAITGDNDSNCRLRF
jgi:murein DD-endopeptidase MepM/ murein hydrolase activator NlpD